MKDHRNPFLLQASEHIEADLTFVRLFGPGALDLLKTEQAISTKIFFSAPGGGKTSLLRLFTPGPLLELHRHREVTDCKELFEKMKGLRVVDDDGPRVLGISLSCDRGYVNLGDIGLDAVKQSRLLFALLDARIMLAAVRHAMALKRMRSDDQCSRLKFLRPAGPIDLPGLELPCTGEELRVWARRREDEICATLDSFSPEDTTAAGSEGLQSLDLLKPGNVLFDNQPIAEQVLIMLDDVQRLTELQRQRLIQFILDKRSSTPVWIAERMEALSRDEILDPGTIHGRDYEPVLLENYWRSAQKRFENVVINIADRRVRDSRSIELSHFEACLEDSLDGPEWRPKFEEILGVVRERVLKRAANTSLFNNWLREHEALQGSAQQRAVAWRALEILIERELRRSQGSFGFELEAEVWLVLNLNRLLPSPARNPRRGDNLVIDYHDLLFDSWGIEPKNFIYASEQNPFEVYRQIVRAICAYRESFAPLGGAKFVLSALSTKLLSVGALLVAYDFKAHKFDVGIAHVDCHGYDFSSPETPPDGELFGLWLAGEWEIASAPAQAVTNPSPQPK